jgi:hypothetical protein
MSESYSTKDVSAHNKVEAEGGMWIIIDNDVYNVTDFVDEHPGGAKILKRVGGKDASKQFWKVTIPISSPSYGFLPPLISIANCIFHTTREGNLIIEVSSSSSSSSSSLLYSMLG